MIKFIESQLVLLKTLTAIGKWIVCKFLNTVIAGLTRNPGFSGEYDGNHMKEEKYYYVYILASKRNGTLYIGVTSNLADRVYKHKQGIYDGFTKKYKVNKLVYYEVYNDVRDAINREKQLKNWRRKWKIELIEQKNTTWRDLSDDL